MDSHFSCHCALRVPPYRSFAQIQTSMKRIRKDCLLSLALKKRYTFSDIVVTLVSIFERPNDARSHRRVLFPSICYKDFLFHDYIRGITLDTSKEYPSVKGTVRGQVE